MAGNGWITGALVAITLLIGLEPSSQAKVQDRVRLEARLGGEGTPASGKAKFEARGNRLRLSVEVEDFLTPSGVAEVIINGAAYTLTLSAGGFGDLNLDTANGQSVPNLSGGGTITVSVGDEVIKGSF